MTSNITENIFLKKWCREQPIFVLFSNDNTVLAGDELGAFYLDKWATSNGTLHEDIGDTSNDPYYLWNKRDPRVTNESYMALVHAAHEAGVKDIVIDMSPDMQPGIAQALQAYWEESTEKMTEAVFNAQLYSALSTPMDAVVQTAAVLEMKVHALNSGLSDIATLFREARGIVNTPVSGSLKERASHYLEHGFDQDKITLMYIMRRNPTELELDTMRYTMLQRLSDGKENIEASVFDEAPTVGLIKETIADKPFLGFFQNGRLFSSAKDLDSLIRQDYGNKKVVRVAMHLTEDMCCAKPPQYHFNHSIKGCTVAMTEEYAKFLQMNRIKPEQASRTSPKIQQLFAPAKR